MMRIDPDGLPSVVQRVRYSYTHMWWEADLFTGRRVYFSSDWVSPQIGLMDRFVHPLLCEAVRKDITALVLKHPEEYLQKEKYD